MQTRAVRRRRLGAARGRRSAAADRRRPPKAAAPIDLTGYWVSIVSEDWRYRMVTPTKGDYQGVPMTPDAVKVAEAWNPEADTAAGNQCRSYGAPAIMRVPGRVHITWEDDRDAEARGRRGHADAHSAFRQAGVEGRAELAGRSVAEWEMQTPAAGRGGRMRRDAARSRS